jgi:tetratricopeptide (TPR) repeat protein
MNKAVSLDNLSLEALIERGSLLLKQEKVLDAIACFNHLLKLEERAEFLQGLEQAYLGRIIALANKSMLKEALALLDIQIQRFPDATVDPLRLKLLLQATHYNDAAKLYNQCHGQLTHEQRQQLDALFGALLLSSNDVKLSDFETDSAIVRIYPKALAAIDMSCTSQPDKLEDVLRQIPIRSPYRDLRTLLTGLHHFSRGNVKGKEILLKIAADSPYHSCATGFIATTVSSKSLLADLAATPKADRSKLPELNDLPVSHIRVLVELAKSHGKPYHLYQIVHRHERCFGKGEKIELYRKILPFCREQAVIILERSKEFALTEKVHLCALAAEQDNFSRLAVTVWSDYLQMISRKDSTGPREIAMVIRRQATLMQKERHDYSPQKVLDTMLKSLEYDSDHAPTWIDASEYARRYLGTKHYYAIIQDAVQKLPGDVAILLAAMRASSNRGAHKKAAGLAEKVLALDPINTAALDFIVASRLEHGRKLASQKKWALAEKELLAADTRARSIRLKGRSRICLGMLLLFQYNDSGLQHIEVGRQENPYPLFGHILVALESRLYGLTKVQQKEFDNDLKQHVHASQAIDPREFNRLISWILGFEVKHWPMLKQTCHILKGYFTKALSLNLSHAEGLSLSKALEQIDLPIALFKCSSSLKKKYPDVLEFKVWHLLASAWKQNKPMTFAEDDEMENLFDDLVDTDQFDFIDHVENILEKRGLECSLHFDNDFMEEEEYSIDFGPFGAPKTMPDQAKPKSPSTPAKPAGKQLNLFDDQS